MKRWLRWVWPALVVGAWIALLVAGLDPRTALSEPVAAVQGSAWFAAALLAAYAARALVLLPSTLLTLLAGFALGAGWGSAVALTGTTVSALIAYALARGVGPDAGASGDGATDPPARGWRVGLREAPFTATLIARLALIPGDLVNVVAGTTRTPWRPFALATAIGGAPGLIAAVLAGTSLQGAFDPEAARIAPGPLLASVGLAVVAALAAVWAQRRARRPDQEHRAGGNGRPERASAPEDGPRPEPTPTRQESPRAPR